MTQATPLSRHVRELRAETTIDAQPAEVWAKLTDLSRMPAWSPELVRMVPLAPGGLAVGRTYLGINRIKAVVWVTRNVIVAIEPERTLAWDTVTVGAQWIYELTPVEAGTRLVLRRPMTRFPAKLKAFPDSLAGRRTRQLESGMRQTLAGIKAEVESR